jgi:RNA polymerase sigma-70 factor (ECF subfamily)
MSRAERRGVRVLRLDAVDDAGVLPASPDPAPGIDRSSDLRDAIAKLSLDHRSVLALHYALDLPIREVAATLGAPDGTVKSRLNAALAALRRSLAEGEG